MEVPLLDLKRQYRSIKTEIDSAIQRVVNSQHFILGEEVERFEQEVASYCGAEHAIGVASGTDALKISLKAVGVGEGKADKVITTPFTYFATGGSIINAGARPVFVDINPDTFNIDPAGVRELLEEETEAKSGGPGSIESYKAIIPVHLFGQMADMGPITDLAEDYDLDVIEDAAQAIGAKYQDRKSGSLGSAGCFSFFPTKNLGGYGDGGMIVTDDDNIAEKSRMLRVHGSKEKYYNEMIGYNSRLDALQAAVLSAKLPHLDDWSHQRAVNASKYTERLKSVLGIETPAVAGDRNHIYHQYTIRISGNRRDDLQGYLKRKGIGSKVYYPLPLHLQGCFEDLGYEKGDFPVSEKAAEEVLSLPIFPELESKEIDYVADAINEFVG